MAALAIVVGAALAALAGLGAASAVFGGGWVWPHGSPSVVHTLASLPTSHPGAGLGPPQDDLVPGAKTVRPVVIVVEAAYLAASVLAAVLVTRYRRPGDARGGMATRAEAAAVLGPRQLRQAARVIRPDLQPSPRQRRANRPRGRGPR